MIKKVVKYEDFDGNIREEEFYFGLTKAELTDMQLSVEGGFQNYLDKIINAKSQKELIDVFKNILYLSYGEKSADGKRMIKTEDVKLAFTQTQAYSDLYMELISNDDAAIKFIMGIMPKDIDVNMDDILKQIKEKQ